MTDKLNILDNNTINSEKMQAINKKPLKLFYLRVSICLTLLTTILILKIVNPQIFSLISEWYKANILHEDEKINHAYEYIKEFFLNINSFIPKVQTFFSNFKF